MTWNPLRKQKLTTKPSPAIQAIDSKSDQKLESLFLKLQQSEELSRKLQKDMRKYLEGVASCSKQEQQITTELSASPLCVSRDELRQVVEDYHSVTSQVSDSVKALIDSCQKTFQEPLKKYGTVFPDIDARFRQREQLVQEWREAGARVRKYELRERTAKNFVKLEQARRALQAAAATLVSCHEGLLSELREFTARRAAYLNPSVRALVRAHLEQYGETTRLFTHLCRFQDAKGASPSSAVMPEREFQALIDDKMARIQSLMIVKKKK
ncbi:bridging integrator 3-like isoform X2 [Bacillus rossius redtenbacheri]|uniref:bridging integrator 3-like isoform X2 n=1 Tax=Bacillus rossius redtenbacheri TaxID=93214 RepID=UPI002FDE1F12